MVIDFDERPETNLLITGIVDTPDVTITAMLDGQEVEINLKDGIWEINLEDLSVGNHKIRIVYTDLVGNSSYNEADFVILRADADIPTVNFISQTGGDLEISGTYDYENSQSLSVEINSKVYVLGEDDNLTTELNIWKLKLKAGELPYGKYDVIVTVTSRNQNVFTDQTNIELEYLEPKKADPIADDISSPNTGIFGSNLGVSIVPSGILILAISIAVIVFGYIFKKYRSR